MGRRRKRYQLKRSNYQFVTIPVGGRVVVYSSIYCMSPLCLQLYARSCLHLPACSLLFLPSSLLLLFQLYGIAFHTAPHTGQKYFYFIFNSVKSNEGAQTNSHRWLNGQSICNCSLSDNLFATFIRHFWGLKSDHKCFVTVRHTAATV